MHFNFLYQKIRIFKYRELYFWSALYIKYAECTRDPKRIDIARSTILSINPIQAWRENNESSREFRERNGKQRQNAMRTSTGATGPQKIMDT